MANDFSKVSLGFAEFVSQLLHETFDAVLSAQNYQLEKYSEFEKALSISNESFKVLYVTDGELESRETELYGSLLTANMSVDASFIITLQKNNGNIDIQQAVVNNKLTGYGLDAARSAISDLVVNEKKAKLRQLIDHSQMVRLMVDSGEIKAKLELSNLYEQQEQATKTVAPLKNLPAGQPLKIVKEQMQFIPKGRPAREYVDPVSKQKILLVDRTALLESQAASSIIPRLRLVATPVTSTSSSSLFSEVTIKFKTI